MHFFSFPQAPWSLARGCSWASRANTAGWGPRAGGGSTVLQSSGLREDLSPEMIPGSHCEEFRAGSQIVIPYPVPGGVLGMYFREVSPARSWHRQGTSQCPAAEPGLERTRRGPVTPGLCQAWLSATSQGGVCAGTHSHRFQASMFTSKMS